MRIALWEHNKTAYEAACRLLDTAGKAAVIHPTGTGKSYLGFALCADEPDKTICWLSPSEYIFLTQVENLKRQTGGGVPENLRFYTYPKLAGMSEEEIAALQPDYIVLDEFHRCGAPMWGQGVQRLLCAHPGARLLGLSATNIRYLDNRRDMAQELFDGHIASQMTLGEAIVRGILAPPTYVTALYSYQKDLHRYEERVRRLRQNAVRCKGEQALEALRRALEKADGLDEIFRKHMVEAHGKYVVFCANARHMRQMIQKVPEHFAKVDPAPHLYSVYANDPAASQAFADFKQDSSPHLKLLFCIDMLNEGIHLEDISGVILFRPTVSPIVFKQQIGRALCAGRGAGAVILDIVDNITSLYSIGVLQEEMDDAAQLLREEGTGHCVIHDTFRIFDEVQDCRQLFEELEETLSASWETMYEAAESYYRQEGNLLPPHSYITEEGLRLGRWVVAQRNNYAKGELSPERRQRLEAIGMEWTTIHERLWEENYAQAKAYADTHGHLRVAEAEAPKLYAWLLAQRAKNRRGQLSQEQQQRLSDIGMVWEIESTWEAYVVAAGRFYKKHGHWEIPAACITDEGLRLGAWYRQVRRQYREGRLSEKRIRQLTELGLPWNSTWERRWKKYWQAAEACYQDRGNLCVGADFVTEDGIRLGQWLSVQRQRYAKGRLSATQIEQLEQVGMCWNKEQQRWETAFALAKAYYKAHGHLQIPAAYVTAEGFALGDWLSAQRRQYRQGKLSDEQIQQLSGLDICWDIAEDFWQQGYRCAEDYYRAQGHLRIAAGYRTEDGFHLGAWIANQKARAKKGLLTAEQTEALERIGMVWQVQKQRWQTGYEYARRYAKEHGCCCVAQKYLTPEGYPLGQWIDSQRRAYRRGNLRPENIRQLEDIGMVWEPQEERWQQGYIHAAAYCRAFGPIPVAQTYRSPDGFALGEWMRNQQRQFLRGSLEPKRQALLQELGLLPEAVQTQKGRKEAVGGR